MWSVLRTVNKSFAPTWTYLKTHLIGSMAESIRHGFGQAYISVLAEEKQATKKNPPYSPLNIQYFDKTLTCQTLYKIWANYKYNTRTILHLWPRHRDFLSSVYLLFLHFFVWHYILPSILLVLLKRRRLQTTEQLSLNVSLHFRSFRLKVALWRWRVGSAETVEENLWQGNMQVV